MNEQLQESRSCFPLENGGAEGGIWAAASQMDEMGTSLTGGLRRVLDFWLQVDSRSEGKTVDKIAERETERSRSW